MGTCDTLGSGRDAMGVNLPFETITITFNDTISNYVPGRREEVRLSAVLCKVGCLGYLIDFID